MIYQSYFSTPVVVHWDYMCDPWIPIVTPYIEEDWKKEGDNTRIVRINVQTAFRDTKGMGSRPGEAEWTQDTYALHLVNRQIYHEVQMYMYQNTMFSFQMMPAFRRFVNIMPQRSLKWINHLALDMAVSRTMKTDWWKQFQLQKVPDVKGLILRCDLGKGPPIFKFGERWVKMLVNIGTKGPWKIKTVNVVLSSKLSEECTLSKMERMPELKVVETMHIRFAKCIEDLCIGKSEFEAIQQYRDWVERKRPHIQQLMLEAGRRRNVWVQVSFEQLLDFSWFKG
jgi:hypothetical protein